MRRTPTSRYAEQENWAEIPKHASKPGTEGNYRTDRAAGLAAPAPRSPQRGAADYSSRQPAAGRAAAGGGGTRRLRVPAGPGRAVPCRGYAEAGGGWVLPGGTGWGRQRQREPPLRFWAGSPAASGCLSRVKAVRVGACVRWAWCRGAVRGFAFSWCWLLGLCLGFSRRAGRRWSGNRPAQRSSPLA